MMEKTATAVTAEGMCVYSEMNSLDYEVGFTTRQWRF
jgi:hypothetical protein